MARPGAARTIGHLADLCRHGGPLGGIVDHRFQARTRSRAVLLDQLGCQQGSLAQGVQDRRATVRAWLLMRSGNVDSSQEGRSEWPQTRGDLALTHLPEQGRRAQAEREEVEARTRLLRAEERREDAETACIETKTTHVESETRDLDFASFRKGTLFVLAVAIAVIFIVRLLADPNLLSTAGAGVAVALLSWLGKS